MFLNFLVATILASNSVKEGYCSELTLTTMDCIGFGISNAIWSFIFHFIITSITVLRRLSNNCRNTTFWKP
jgi:hypothetical protein